MSKNSFKEFVSNNPSLIKYVNEDKMTWQKFYEMYELFGSDNKIWNNYIKKDEEVVTAATSVTAIKELLNMVKNINLEKVQKGVENLQKTITLIQDLGGNKNVSTIESKPTFKHFND